MTWIWLAISGAFLLGLNLGLLLAGVLGISAGESRADEAAAERADDGPRTMDHGRSSMVNGHLEGN